MALVSVAGDNRAGLLYILGQVGGNSPQEQYCSNTGVIQAVLHFKAISTERGDIHQDCHHAAWRSGCELPIRSWLAARLPTFRPRATADVASSRSHTTVSTN
jgi:hypothetical protein